MGVSWADNSVKIWPNLPISNPKPDLLNVNAYSKFDENPLLFTKLSSGNDFVCVEVLRSSQPNGVMSSAVSLPNHTFTGQA